MATVLPASIRRRRRRVISVVVCLALAGCVVAAVILHKPKAKAVAATASIFKTATVKLGDLTTTESVDGAVQLSATLTVLHRIEGQTSSSAGSANAASTATSTPSSNGASNGTNNGANSGATASSATALPGNDAAALLDCSAPATPTPR